MEWQEGQGHMRSEGVVKRGLEGSAKDLSVDAHARQ